MAFPKTLAPEEIKANFDRFLKLIERIAPPRRAAVEAMVCALEERLMFCPGSSRVEYHNCFPGGLVEHSIRVVKNASKLKSALGIDVRGESLILCGLFHDIGKVGDERDDYYIDQKSQWHRDKGMLYEVNPKIRYMETQQRSVYLMSHFGVKLDHDEYLAILLNDGQYVESNRPYAMKEPALATLIHMADVLACKEEKGQLSLGGDKEGQ